MSRGEKKLAELREQAIVAFLKAERATADPNVKWESEQARSEFIEAFVSGYIRAHVDASLAGKTL